jgi:flagellar motor switch protein FliG
MGVGDSVSAEVLRRLAPEEVRRISAEIAATPAVVSDQLISVFHEFEARTTEGRLYAKGGADCAKRLVEHAFGPDSALKLIPAAGVGADAGEPSILQRTDPQQLAAFLKSEHPQTIAVLLCSVPGKVAATLLAGLPAETQGQVVVRMASLDRVSAEAFQKVTEAVGNKLKNTRKVEKADGVRALAALLNNVPPEHAEALLGCVEEQNLELATSVRNGMFVFEDVLSIPTEGMKGLIARLDRKVLTLALKGTSAKVRTHFTQCMSQRSGEMLTEDMEALGPVRVRDVKAAQAEIIVVVRKLQQEGTISLGGGGSDEYVD